MKTNTLIPSYKLVQNNTATAAKAPYYGMVIPVGSIAYADILQKMVDDGTFVTEATAEYLLAAFYEYCRETIASDVVRVSTGTVSVYPMISGSFDSEDAAFDPTRNTLYVGASFSQDLRDAVAGVTPAYGGEESASGVHLDSEMDIASQRFKVIDGTGDFRLAGRNLAVPDGADESIALYAKDGITKVSDIVVSENDGGQRLTCHLKGDTAVAKGQYKLILKTHGLDPTAPLATLSLNVTNVTAYEPPVPKITNLHGDGNADGQVSSEKMLVIEGKYLGDYDPTTFDGLVVNYTAAGAAARSSIPEGGIESVTATKIVTNWPIPLNADVGTSFTATLTFPDGKTATGTATVVAA